MPVWSHAHPLIVHFPIALLLVAPLIVLLGLLWPAQRPGIQATALILLTLGTVAAVLAVATGLAASGPVRGGPELMATLAQHESRAESTTLLYVGLTLALLLIRLLPWFSKRGATPNLLLALHLFWLAASVGATLSLIQTGHLGGRMVHELGLHTQGLQDHP